MGWACLSCNKNSELMIQNQTILKIIGLENATPRRGLRKSKVLFTFTDRKWKPVWKQQAEENGMLATESRQLAGLSRAYRMGRGVSKRREVEWSRIIGGQGSGLMYVSEKLASVEGSG